jgi:inositol-phosphate transport system permease protein
MSTLAGYALSRISFRGRTAILIIKLIGRAVPAVGMLIGAFFVLFYIGLLYTIPGVVLLRTSIGLPLTIWIMKGFFDSIPWDIEQSALIDGCTRFGVWRKVLFPLVTPGIAAIALLSFSEAWEDFIYVYILLPKGQANVLSVLIQGLIATEVIDYPLLAAMSLFYSLPPIIFFILCQKFLVKVTIVSVRG